MLKVNNWLDNIQNRLFAPVCLLCGAPGADGLDLCAACGRDLPMNEPACRRCAGQLTGISEQVDDPVCGQCLKQAPFFDRTLCPFRYEAPLNQMLTGLKYHQKLAPARILGNLLADYLLSQKIELPECVIPVPLHGARMRTRGYNQAMELVRPVVKRMGLRVERRLCVRSRATEPQTHLSAKDRRTNIRKAFHIKGICNYRHVAILDDVITTGHTVSELARTLRQAGVEYVQVWGIARAVAPR